MKLERQRGIIRGHICTFDVFGQPGTWQDAACLMGIERLIMESYDDTAWVHSLLKILQQRKLAYTKSLSGAAYDVIELGGGGVTKLRLLATRKSASQSACLHKLGPTLSDSLL